MIEPGHTRWHGDATQTLDGQDHTRCDARRYAGLARASYRVLPLTEVDLAPPQRAATLRRIAALITVASPIASPSLNAA